MLVSSLTVQSRDREHDAIFQNARADSVELEMVRAQNRAIEAEKLLNELVEQVNVAKDEMKKKSEDMAKLEEVVAELKVQNQQLMDERDAAADMLAKSNMLIAGLKD